MTTGDDKSPTQQPGIGERMFVVVVLLLALGAFQNLAVTGPIDEQNMGMLGMQVLWSLLYLITFGFYSRSCARPLRHLSVVYPLLFLLAFVLLSTFWSQDTWLTLRRAVALILTMVFGVYFSTRFTVKDQLRLLAVCFYICIIFSFFFELLGLNPDQRLPGWYGVFFIKVHLGRNMALSSIVFVFLEKAFPAYRAFARTGLVASLVLVVLARDVTSWIALILSLILLAYLTIAVRKSVLWVASTMVLLLSSGMMFAFYAVTNLGNLTELVGKDPTLTGRVPLWVLSVVMALRRPWLGYGFNAFWLPDEFYTRRIWHLIHWMPPHAHNGFLELWLELGLIGAGSFLLLFVYYLAKAVVYLRRGSDSTAAWPLTFLIFLFFASLTESEFLGSNSVAFMLFVAVAATVSIKAIDSAPEGRRGAFGESCA